MDWSWWSTELAVAIAGLHYMKNMVYEYKANKREELFYFIFDLARCKNGPDVLIKVQIIANIRSSVTVDNQTHVHCHF
jgi:hypothetical protein